MMEYAAKYFEAGLAVLPPQTPKDIRAMYYKNLGVCYSEMLKNHNVPNGIREQHRNAALENWDIFLSLDVS